MTNNFIFSLDFFPKIGGAHCWLYNVGRYWPEPICVITSSYKDALNEQFLFDAKSHGSILEIKRYSFGFKSLGLDYCFFKNLAILAKLLKNSPSPSIFHVIRAIPEGAILALLKKLFKDKLKFFTYAHGEEFLIAQTSRQLKFLTSLALKYTNKVIANSFSTKKLIVPFCDLSIVEVVHPGVDYHRYQLSSEKRYFDRKKLGLSDESILLITVARLEARKNHAAVMKIMAELRQKGYPLYYLVIGDGEERKKLEELTKDLNIDPYVKFLGWVDETEKVNKLCCSDIYVMPSIRKGPMIEGFGIVFIEAAAAGLPAISGNVGGQPEAVLDKRTGFVIDGNNLFQLKVALERLIVDTEMRQNMGLKAKKWAKKHDWHIVARKIFNIVRN